MYEDHYSESSGIALSQNSDSFNCNFSSVTENLRLIAEYHTDVGKRDNARLVRDQTRQDSTPYFPRIESNARHEEKKNNNFKPCDYRITSLPKMQVSGPPPTVGKYRQKKTVVSTFNLPSPTSPRLPSPPHPTHQFIREQYKKERYQQSPGFSGTDIARIFDHYSLSRYLASGDSTARGQSTCSPTLRTDFPSNCQLPHIHQKESYHRDTTKPIGKIWVSQLSSWLPERQEKRIQYFHFGSPSTITVKNLPICSKCHDFFHHNLNWDIRNWIPELCPRYLRYHHQKVSETKKKQSHPKLPSLKRKPPTVAKDPFSSKTDRKIKLTALKQPKPKKDQDQASIPQILDPQERDDSSSSQWMIDNSTMTEDSYSDIFRIVSSLHEQPPSLVNESNRQPRYTKKRRDVVMEDKGCDVMTPTEQISRSSYLSEDSINEDFKEFHQKDDLADYQFTEETGVNEDADANKFLEKNEEIVKETNGNTAEEISTAREIEDYSANTVQVDSKSSDDKDLEEVDTLSNIADEGDAASESKDTSLSNYICEATVDRDDISIASDELSSLNQIRSPSVREIRPPPLPPLPKYLFSDGAEGSEAFSDSNPVSGAPNSKSNPVVVIPLPTFNEREESAASWRSDRTPISIHTPSSQSSSMRRRKAMRDRAVAEEMRREQLAEERRKRASDKFERAKRMRRIPPTKIPERDPSPDEFDFLDRFALLNQEKLEMYKRTFDSFDIDEDGYLDTEEVYLAMKKVLPSHSLENSHVSHISRLLELVGYDVKSGKIDFKLFTIISSLAGKIAALDGFMKGLVDRFDLQALDGRMWRAKQFFDYFVDDPEKRTISMDSLWIELKAGGIGVKHEKQIRNSLKHLRHLDILDFLTYLPLFTLTHSQAVSHPLREERVL